MPAALLACSPFAGATPPCSLAVRSFCCCAPPTFCLTPCRLVLCLLPLPILQAVRALHPAHSQLHPTPTHRAALPLYTCPQFCTSVSYTANLQQQSHTQLQQGAAAEAPNSLISTLQPGA